MEPVRVTAHENSRGAVELDAYDARDLLERGNQAFAAGRFGEAVERYDQLLSEFPESGLVPAAHYNAALCLARLDRVEEAAERYLALVDRAPESPDVTDALFQAAQCFERLESWERATRTFDRVLERSNLTPDQRLEAMARRGAALVHASRYEEAEIQLRRAIAFNSRSEPDTIRNDYYLAEAQYYLGEVPRLAMRSIELTSDEASFREALEHRAELLLRAQTQYVQAIRVGNAHWGAAAAYRIGEMYSGLFDDVMAVPVGAVEVPPDLTSPEEIRTFLEEFPLVYRRLLRQRLEPLLHNAIRWWESNLMMVERTGVRGEWVGRTRTNLERVRALLEEIVDEGSSGAATDPVDGTVEPGDPP
jgi:tetratricopeptide (TPR) repeat protein